MGRLSDYCDIGSSKRIFAKQTTDSGIPFYRGAEITDLANKRFPSNQKYISKELYDDFSRKYYMPKINDILITAVGTIGSVWQVDTTEPFYYQDSISIILYNFKKSIEPKFLYYFLINESIQNYMKNSIINSVQKKLSIDFLRNMEIDLPSIEEQKERVRNLEIIDSLIMNNNLLVTKLKENLATNYSYWFHQFDFPDENGNAYKASGGKMVWNEELQREIPGGWEVVELKQFINEINVTPNETANIDTIDLSVIPTNSLLINEYNSSNNFDTNLRVLEKGNILFGLIRPYLKKCLISPINGIVTGTVAQFKPKEVTLTDFILAMMTSDDYFQYAINNSTGTKMPVIKPSQLLEYKFPINKTVLSNFTRKNSSHALIVNLLKQNNELIKYKKFLLPFILTGFPRE